MVECTDQNTHLRNILSVRPPYEKNKLLLNEYLGDFMHFETIFFIFFFAENDIYKPTNPTKVRKFRAFFETFLNKYMVIKIGASFCWSLMESSLLSNIIFKLRPTMNWINYSLSGRFWFGETWLTYLLLGFYAYDNCFLTDISSTFLGILFIMIMLALEC